ncbi:MAG: BamA/TamA family outer membrane protein [Flavobacteriales bacterium]|nr:BamA/TamA family outer membrane protein [Flavobacteriales bacterium]
MRAPLTILLLLLVGVISEVNGQNPLKLRISYTSNPGSFDPNLYRLPKEVADAAEARKEIDNLLRILRSEGMLEAGCDLLRIDSTEVHAELHTGPVYRWGVLDYSDIPGELLPGTIRDMRPGDRMEPNNISELFERILVNLENRGFPFASLKLDSIAISGDQITARVFLQKGELFVYDSIYLSGSSALSRNFLEKYLRIEKGRPYSEEEVRKIDARLGRLPYVKLLAPTRVYFGKGKVRIQIQIDERAADRIDGIVGFAPNSDQNDRNLLLTGEFNLEFKNLFDRGVGFMAHWKSFLRQSQELNLNLSYPYIFKSNVGVDGGLDLMKLDTTFLRIRSELGARVLLGGLDHVRFFFENQSTTLLTADTGSIRFNRTLPLNNPVQVNSYGMEIRLNNLDYPLNPYSGYAIRAQSAVGTRIIQRHPDIEAVQFDDGTGLQVSVYDLIRLRSTQIAFSYDAEAFIPLRKKSTLRFYTNGYQLIAERILRNDLYRFGGARSLRGFDEKALEGSSVHQIHLEYRYLLSRDANFHLFANAAYYENGVSANSGLFSDRPYGFGAGVNLAVGNGVLNLDYALGSEKGNPIQFNQAKIHFGIINYL